MATFLESEFFLHFFVALGLGALIGLEREHRRDETTVIAGVRTFPLFSLAGYMLGVVAQASASPFVLASGILLAGAVSIGFLFVRHRIGIHGLTTPMAMVVTFLLGMLIAYDFVQEAVVIGVATTFLLLTKGRLHRFADRLTDDEMMSALQFITIVFILFPLAQTVQAPFLGQEWIGRGRIVDPFQILLVVVFVASISFASFLALRTVGAQRGFEISGLLGGLVNSEATSISLAARARDASALVLPAAVGVLAATGTMFVRNVVILAFASGARAPEIVVRVLPTAIMGAVVAAALALWLRSRARRESGETGRLDVRNPFAVPEALKFAFVFAALSAAVTLLLRSFGEPGVYAAALGGFAYAGAVMASLGTLVATGQVEVGTAAITAGLALVAGAVNKLVILRHSSAEVHRAVVLPLLATGAGAAIGLALSAAFVP